MNWYEGENPFTSYFAVPKGTRAFVAWIEEFGKGNRRNESNSHGLSSTGLAWLCLKNCKARRLFGRPLDMNWHALTWISFAGYPFHGFASQSSSWQNMAKQFKVQNPNPVIQATGYSTSCWLLLKFSLAHLALFLLPARVLPLEIRKARAPLCKTWTLSWVCTERPSLSIAQAESKHVKAT